MLWQEDSNFNSKYIFPVERGMRDDGVWYCKFELLSKHSLYRDYDIDEDIQNRCFSNEPTSIVIESKTYNVYEPIVHRASDDRAWMYNVTEIENYMSYIRMQKLILNSLSC